MMDIHWNLFLDDWRSVEDTKHMSPTMRDLYKMESWKIARSHHEVCTLVNEHGFPSRVSFDYDLGYDTWSGIEVAQWLIDHDKAHGSMPDKFQYTIHSTHPNAPKIGILMNQYLDTKVTK